MIEGENKINIEFLDVTKCNKKFLKSKELSHFIHISHEVFTIFIWGIILILLFDVYYHFLNHNLHMIIVWCEFICYSVFLFGPLLIKNYQDYKIQNCIENYNKNKQIINSNKI